jgi:argininosuccinate lyase
MTSCGVDYRTAYQVVGLAVRTASRAGLRGLDLDGAMLDRAAVQVRGAPFGCSDPEPAARQRLDRELAEVLDPRAVVQTRTAPGGAAPAMVEQMAADCTTEADRLRLEVGRRRAATQAAERALVAEATRVAGSGGNP